jgi:hypothetical protein
LISGVSAIIGQFLHEQSLELIYAWASFMLQNVVFLYLQAQNISQQAQQYARDNLQARDVYCYHWVLFRVRLFFQYWRKAMWMNKGRKDGLKEKRMEG